MDRKKLFANNCFSKKNIVVFFVGAFLPMAASATILTFENGTDSGQLIANGYGGLNWSNVYVVNSSLLPPGPVTGSTGYHNGTVSGNFVAFNTVPAVVSGSVFDFNGAYLTAAWHNGLNITVSGSLNNQMLYSETVIVDTYNPTWFMFNYNGIDKLTINSFGGVDSGNFSGPDSTMFVMDDFTFQQPSTVPIPAAVWLFGSGLLGLTGAARRRKST